MPQHTRHARASRGRDCLAPTGPTLYHCCGDNSPPRTDMPADIPSRLQTSLGGRYRTLYDKQYDFEMDRFVNPGEDFTPEPEKPVVAPVRSGGAL